MRIGKIDGNRLVSIYLSFTSQISSSPVRQADARYPDVYKRQLHNIPEGMAVGVVYAGYLSGSAQITAAGALALSLGIAIQNFPEGAIISLPLRAEGMGKARAFWLSLIHI